MVKKESIKIVNNSKASKVVERIRAMVQEHSDAQEELMRRSEEIHREFYQRHQDLFTELMVITGRPAEEWNQWTLDLTYTEHGVSFMVKRAEDNPLASILQNIAIGGRPN